MAKRKATGKDNLKSMDRDAYWVDEITQEAERAVRDVEAGEKLDAIASALGASTNTSPTIYNVTATLNNTEYSQILPTNSKRFLIKSRNKGKLKLAYTVGGTSTAYITIPLGAVFEDSSFYSEQTIYFQTTQPGDVIEIAVYV